MTTDQIEAGVVRTSSGCWLWKFAKTTEGYGQLRVGGKREYTHRVVWAARHGPVPSTHYVRHLCHHPSCCNPEHLALTRKGEGIPLTPERVGPPFPREKRYRVPPEVVLAVRERGEVGWTVRELAEHFGLSRNTVRSYLRWRTRKDG
jgi:hypothetical protein